MSKNRGQAPTSTPSAQPRRSPSSSPGADEVDGIYAHEVRVDEDKVEITFADDNGDTVTAHAKVLSIDFSEIE